MTDLKLPAALRGKYVTRAAFVKLQAEKKRLLADIKLMALGSAEGGVTWSKWKKHFKAEKEWNEALRSAILQSQRPNKPSNSK